jgi:transcriptional regulator with XRE-family HTH domain
MLATNYTADPASFVRMRNRLHENPQQVLSRNLAAVLESKKLSVRELERQLKKKGITISNRTIQNMVNGTGNPGLEPMMAVAAHIRVPLWQLFCEGADLSTFTDESVTKLLTEFAQLSEFGRRRTSEGLAERLELEEKRKAEQKNNSEAHSAT